MNSGPPTRISIEDVLGEDEGFQKGPAPSIVHFQELEIWPGAREIHITEEITEDTGAWFFKCVRWFEERCTNSAIRLVLSTPGGDIESMFTIHDTIRNTPCPVEIVGIGDICSAGVLILASGDRRLVAENASLMSHESSGPESDLGFRASKDRFKYREWQHLRWCELMARYTPEDAKWWKNKTERQAEYWLLGGQAIVDIGLADEVITVRPTGYPALSAKRETPFHAGSI